MIGKDCILKNYNLIGIIKAELPATDNYPEQWGIYWYGPLEDMDIGNHNAGIIRKHGAPHYWNDKDSIIII